MLIGAYVPRGSSVVVGGGAFLRWLSLVVVRTRVVACGQVLRVYVSRGWADKT